MLRGLSRGIVMRVGEAVVVVAVVVVELLVVFDCRSILSFDLLSQSDLFPPAA